MSLWFSCGILYWTVLTLVLKDPVTLVKYPPGCLPRTEVMFLALWGDLALQTLNTFVKRWRKPKLLSLVIKSSSASSAVQCPSLHLLSSVSFKDGPSGSSLPSDSLNPSSALSSFLFSVSGSGKSFLFHFLSLSSWFLLYMAKPPTLSWRANVLIWFSIHAL